MTDRLTEKVRDRKSEINKLLRLNLKVSFIPKTSYQHHLQRGGQLMGGRSGHSWVEVEVELQ